MIPSIQPSDLSLQSGEAFPAFPSTQGCGQGFRLGVPTGPQFKGLLSCPGKEGG